MQLILAFGLLYFNGGGLMKTRILSERKVSPSILFIRCFCCFGLISGRSLGRASKLGIYKWPNRTKGNDLFYLWSHIFGWILLHILIGMGRFPDCRNFEEKALNLFKQSTNLTRSHLARKWKGKPVPKGERYFTFRFRFGISSCMRRETKQPL